MKRRMMVASVVLATLLLISACGRKTQKRVPNETNIGKATSSIAEANYATGSQVAAGSISEITIEDNSSSYSSSYDTLLSVEQESPGAGNAPGSSVPTTRAEETLPSLEENKKTETLPQEETLPEREDSAPTVREEHTSTPSWKPTRSESEGTIPKPTVERTTEGTEPSPLPTEPVQTKPVETVAPTTAAPTTVAPTTVAPTTVAPTTVAPTTVAPTTVAPTTVAPTTVAPTTVAPTTVAPTTEPETTRKVTIVDGDGNVIDPNRKKYPVTPITARQVELARQVAIKILNRARIEEGAKIVPTPIVGKNGGLNANERAAEFVDPNMTHAGGSGWMWGDYEYGESLAATYFSSREKYPLSDEIITRVTADLTEFLVNEPGHRRVITDKQTTEMCVGIATFKNNAGSLTIQLVVENLLPWE